MAACVSARLGKARHCFRSTWRAGAGHVTLQPQRREPADAHLVLLLVLAIDTRALKLCLEGLNVRQRLQCNSVSARLRNFQACCAHACPMDASS